MEGLRDELKAANLKIAELTAKVDDLHLMGCDKDAKIRSLNKKYLDLQRRLADLEGWLSFDFNSLYCEQFGGNIAIFLEYYAANLPIKMLCNY